MNTSNILNAPEILLPNQRVDLEKWAVIACDQYTQEPDYWEKVERFAGESPSTLRLILPEIFIDAPDRAKRIEKVHFTMQKYLEEGVFEPSRRTFMYLERDTPFSSRRGLIANIDLELYDWRNPEKALVRATEGTVKERVPPRMEIRRGAALEVPHTLLLINDKDDNFLSFAEKLAKQSEPIYRTRLMMDSGAVRGWDLGGEIFSEEAFLAERLESLLEGGKFGFAVGDGNHSLAAAKGVWEEYKAAHGGGLSFEGHSARYAMVEIENIYDKGICFEPIHRVLLGEKAGELLDAFSVLPDFSRVRVDGAEELSRLTAQRGGNFSKSRVGLALESGYYLIEFGGMGLAVALVQPLLDDFIGWSGCVADYVHGEEAVFRGVGRGKAGVLLPPIEKAGLFETVAELGALPRKSFSMGHACEKRFYIECRRLF